MIQVHRIYGAGLLDDVFTITLKTGETVSWNVTKLQKAAADGRLGQVRYFRTDTLPPADWSQWDETDRAKVDRIKTDPAWLDAPVIAVESENPDYILNCFIDGQHRVTARQELGLPEVGFYLLPLSMERSFRVGGFPT